MTSIIRFITHGNSRYAVSRWHRLQSRVLFCYYDIRRHIINWWNRETYVPLFCRARGEMRAVRFSAAVDELGFGDFMLPLSIPTIEGLPHFPTSDACFAHISETWPHLQP